MPIPDLDENGLLPAGVHDCALEEIKARFGVFRGSDRRPQLFAKLECFVSEARKSTLVVCVIVDGSFVTAKSEPDDVDLIIVVATNHDFLSDLTPSAYNILSKQSVRRRYGFDLLVAHENSVEFGQWIEFFQQVRLEPERQKGILRLLL